MRITVRQLKRLIGEAYSVVRKHDKNPFVHTHKFAEGQSVTVGFWVPRLAEPLWWTESGFKDLSRVQAEPHEFETEAKANEFIKNEAIPYINKWRDDDASLIRGW